MKPDNSNIKGAVTGLIVLGLIGVVAYGGYLTFSDKDYPVSIELSAVNTGVLGPRLQKAAVILIDPKEKLSFKKSALSFTETALYKSFVDLPEIVPLSDTRGRPDPFVPYVAP